MNQHEQIIAEVDDIQDMLAEVIGRMQQVESSIPGAPRERFRQVRAQLEMALSSENEWLGRSTYTLDAVRAELEDRYVDENGETEESYADSDFRSGL